MVKTERKLSRGWSAKASLITFDALLLGKGFKEKGAGRQWMEAGKKVGNLGGKTGKEVGVGIGNIH